MMTSIFLHLPMLVIPVALVYGATRHESPPDILLEAIKWLYRLIVFLGTIAIVVAVMSWIA